MKQSTKLLSLLLALVLAFGSFSVIGNAALDKTAVDYDNIDDAALTPEQVFCWCEKNLKVYFYKTIN